MIFQSSSLILLGLLSATISALYVVEKSTLPSTTRGMLPPICCPVPGQPWHPSTEELIGTQIKSLLDHRGTIFASEPHSCNEILCYFESRIILCNEKNTMVQVSSDELARHVGAIKDGCNHCGQAFNSEGFNIIVTKGKCARGYGRRV